ncbi:ABC transporter substrate-binding protein [Corynebacterium riegelii]|uniref:ABC transporter substrate-binding protein n=1 Tax=Corynebacterium riegelii TaxID=156976 RepID=UPI00254F77C8|nr:ABC transporter substrate-binding protein [Corynebacterium riegelii]MDK7180794.1 ABC transporter substrate-binding protein [Corynebacterium riegelii]
MRRLLPISLISALALAGCAGGEIDTTTSTDTSASTSAEASANQIDNCGVMIDAAPTVERAVALEQGSSDTLLLLGAADQIAGVGHQKDNPPEGYETPKIIAPSIPTAEQIRAVDPDFVYSPFRLVWTADSAGTREEWQKLGVRTYQSNVECQDHGENKGKTTFELIERDITELGQLFAHEDVAADLIQKLRDTKAGAAQAPDGTTFAMVYSTIGGAPYVAGGPSIVTEMGDSVNMVNVFGDVKEEWPQISWEALAEADPDVLILGDLPTRGEPGDTWEEKVEALKATPGVNSMRAVKEERFIVINGVTTSPSARSYQGLQQISDAIANGITE